MDREKYLKTQKRLLELARDLAELEVSPFLEAIRTAEVVAPILDPTAFRHGATNLGIIKRLAEAALAFQRAYPAPETVLEGALEAQSYRPAPPPGSGFVGSFASRPLAAGDDDEGEHEVDRAIRQSLDEERRLNDPQTPPAPQTRRAGARAFPEGERGLEQ